jgi:cysteine desulfurase
MSDSLPIYLDANATTRVDPRVADLMCDIIRSEVGNAGSITHEYGRRAKQRIETARRQVAEVVKARRHEIIFTSGATEANNLALLGLAAYGEEFGRRHIVSSMIEHHAVLQPLRELARRGFEVTLVPPTAGGWVEASAIRSVVRRDTLLVSVMQVNNETGVVQPIDEIADSLKTSDAYLHTDAAQGFGKDIAPLQHPRIDLISVSAHKIHGPQGVGALVARRRNRQLPPLQPLFHGGGQEFGLRSGTLPVASIAGFGLAAELAFKEAASRKQRCLEFRQELLAALAPLKAIVNGDPNRSLPNVLNVSFPGWTADHAIEALTPACAVSDGAACTSLCSSASHVLNAMGLSDDRINGGVRFSWDHMTTGPVSLEAAREAALGR